MHVHLPKPLHGWRQFLGEVGIVVIGILIALALEAFADEYRWSGRVAEARQQLRYEVGDNLFLLRWRNQAHRCVEQRLDDLGVILNKATSEGRLPPLGPIGGVPGGIYPMGVWQSQVSAQTGTHLSAGQLAALSRIYRGVEIARQTGDEEEQAWRELWSMVGPGRPVDPSTLDRIASALITARTTNRRLDGIEHNIKGVLAQGTLGDHFPQIDPLNRPQVPSFSNKWPICQPISKDVPPIYGLGPPYKFARQQ